ncbi:MAG: hypothetical protein E7005_00445 [Alphaproteobacteria bacterium]|nr:hypothetical protein [Alphaproteobacteria bacterium]
MTKRKDLIKELKEDAKKAWDFIETCATNIGKYGLLVLSLYSDGSINQHEFAPIKEQEVKNEISIAKFDNKLQVAEIKEAKDFNWGEYSPNNTPFLSVVKTIEDRTMDAYNATIGSKIDKKINIKDLMEKAGVKVEDMQEVVNQNKDILKQLEPGMTSVKLARAADKVRGSLTQNCLLGVQHIFASAGYGDYLDGSNGLWPKKIGNGPYNSACNTNKTLEKTGSFITLSVENTAYNTNKQSLENQEMRAFCKTLPAGTVLICDNKLPDQIEGKNYSTLIRQYGKGGPIHGHVAVKANNGSYKSDGVEPFGPNFARYGERVSFSIPLDTRVPENVAYAFIKQAELRKSKEEEHKYASNANTQSNTVIPTYMMYNNERG